MAKKVIAIDTLGGDPYVIGLDGKPKHEPIVNRAVQGAVKAAQESGIELALIGYKEQIQEQLDLLSPSLSINIVPATKYFEHDDLENSSLYHLLEGLGKDFDGGITIGDTTKIIQHLRGKLHEMAIPNVEQLPLANNLPVRDREKPVLHLDIGANTQCRDRHLYAFAHMARIYLEKTEGKENPKIGILTVGSEGYKGNQLVRRTMYLCEKAGMDVIDATRAEPRDVELSKVDAIVMDGHTGNLLLKAVEAKAETILLNTKGISEKYASKLAEKYAPCAESLKELIVELKNNQPALIDKYGGNIEKLLHIPNEFGKMAKGIIGRLLEYYTSGAYGAASLFCLKNENPEKSAALKKGHGISDTIAFYNAVLNCKKEIDSGLTSAFVDYFTNEFKIPDRK